MQLRTNPELLSVTEINAIDLLEGIYPGFPDILKKATVGEQKVIALKSGERLLQLAVRVSIFKIGHKEIRLAALQDIKNELDEKEMDSWQKLIRVLTHEIINSVTPITSLTSTISGFFRKGDQILGTNDISDEDIREALTGLGYIEDRGKNLINFVSKFRSLTKLPVPRFEKVSLSGLIEGIVILKRDELSAKGIGLSFTAPVENISLFCDRSLIEHVLLNLVNNASDAILAKSNGDERFVEISASGGGRLHPVVLVRDNGIGIPDDLAENVFIPFFITKEHGSGIGLSLSRQIMKLHGGTISVYSKPGVETIFSLIF